jgi:hypothetical protein
LIEPRIDIRLALGAPDQKGNVVAIHRTGSRTSSTSRLRRVPIDAV